MRYKIIVNSSITSIIQIICNTKPKQRFTMSFPTSQAKNNQPTVCLKSQDYLQPVKELSKIFPDIDGQLCSRHSTLFGKLKTTFNKLYDNFQPSHYIVVKGNTHIIGKQDDEVDLSMGLQNGIIILVAKTFPKANIYLNGNHIDEEVILDCKGKVQEGLYQLSAEVQTICQAAIQDYSSQNLCGGIFYVHCNIPEGYYNYKNSLLSALFLSMLAINDGLQNYTVSNLIAKMSETRLIDQMFLQKQFYDYENREFSLMVGSMMYKVPLDRNIKLLFCRLDLAHCDIKHSQTNIKEQKIGKDKILELLQKSFGVKSFYEAFQNQIQIKPKKLDLAEIDNNERLDYMKLIEAEMKELRILCEYSNNNTTIQDLITMKWLIDSRLREIFSEEVVDLVQSVKQKTKVYACTIVEGQFLMMAVDKRKYAELICAMKHLLNRGELKSKSCFKLEQQLVENRWGNEENGISEKIFMSVPSKGIAIFDPSEAIWFD